MKSDTEQNYLWEKRHSILYRIELSVLYHQKRERFFEVCDKLAKAVAVIGGSAAFASFAGENGVKTIAAIITVSSTIALVFSLSDRSRRHAGLSRDFRQLESEIVGRGERDFTEDDIKTWDAKTRLLETDEPAALSALVTLCQNELAIATGNAGRVVRVPLHQRLLAHFFNFTPRPA